MCSFIGTPISLDRPKEKFLAPLNKYTNQALQTNVTIQSFLLCKIVLHYLPIITRLYYLKCLWWTNSFFFINKKGERELGLLGGDAGLLGGDAGLLGGDAGLQKDTLNLPCMFLMQISSVLSRWFVVDGRSLSQ